MSRRLIIDPLNKELTLSEDTAYGAPEVRSAPFDDLTATKEKAEHFAGKHNCELIILNRGEKEKDV